MPVDAPELTLVVPCFNEARRFALPTFEGFLADHPNCRLCLVDDGSTDQTGAMLQRFAAASRGAASLVRLEGNQGKGEAVRRGALHALTEHRPAWLGYWDADLSTPLSEVDHLWAARRDRPEVQLVLGARVARLGARVSRTWYRHYLGRVFATAASLALDLPIYDSQCGAKLMRAGLADVVFREPFDSPWLFDVEILARTVAHLGRAAALAAILEVPLRAWADPGASRLRPSAIIKTPFDLGRIWLAHRGTRRPPE